MEIIHLRDEFIKLGQALKLAGLAESGLDAKEMIQEGLVKVNGEVETRRGRKPRMRVCESHRRHAVRHGTGRNGRAPEDSCLSRKRHNHIVAVARNDIHGSLRCKRQRRQTR